MKRKIIIFSILLGLGFIVVNQIDVDLAPELKRILGRKARAVPADDNAYFAYVGFFAAPELDMNRIGRKVVDTYVDTGRKRDFAADSVSGAVSLEFREKNLEVCRKFDAESGFCLNHYRDHAQGYRRLLKQNKVLLRRYRALLEYKHFHSTEFYIPTTPFSVQRLFLASIGSDWLQGRRKQALREIYADIRFQRMMLAESSLLIYQMISVASINRDLALLGEFIRRCPQCVLNNPQTDNLLSNLDDQELLLQRVMQREVVFSHVSSERERKRVSNRYQIYMDSYYSGLEDKAKRNKFVGLLGYLTLEHATENLIFDKTKKLIALGGAKGREFTGLYRKIRDMDDTGTFRWYDVFYNAGGKLLIQKWRQDRIISHEEIYFAVKHRLDCEIRLTRLLLDIKGRHIPADRITAYLRKTPAADRNPINGKPGEFDSSKNMLYMQVVDDLNAEIQL